MQAIGHGVYQGCVSIVLVHNSRSRIGLTLLNRVLVVVQDQAADEGAI